MNEKLGASLSSLLKTCLLLFFLELILSTLFPALGLTNFRLPLNVLIILFMAFKVQSSFIPVFILILQMVHSLFSIEGWAIGTFAGIIITLITAFLKDLMQFSTYLSTVLMVQIFQLIWLIIVSFIIAIKISDVGQMLPLIWRAIPESIILSLISPFVFKILDRVWKEKSRDAQVGW